VDIVEIGFRLLRLGHLWRSEQAEGNGDCGT
jgi:hypothetical protein